MMIELSPEEARFLDRQLVRHLEHMENELVHTDKQQMQHDLARDVERMRAIRNRVAAIAARVIAA
jgi:hypothetical protein